MKVLIIIISIVGLAAVAGPIIVGIKSFDGTVTENAYEKGLVWDDVQKKKTDLGWNVHIREDTFRTGDHELLISVQDKNGKPLAGSAIAVMIGRPGSSEYDKQADAEEQEEGLYMVKTDFPVYGYWDIQINVTHDNETLLFTRRIFAEKGM